MTSYANASSETSQDNNGGDSNANTKRNRKTQALSALLSATALGVFLEGCGGDTPASAPPPPDLGVLGSVNNPFIGTGSGKTFTGKAGADWVSYTGATSGVEVDFSSDAPTVGGGASGDTLIDIRNIIGSGYDDILTGDDQPNTFRGGAGDDTLDGGAGDDTLDGGAGEDTLQGDAGDDVINGGAGIDELFGLVGKDTLNGDADDDTLHGGAGDDTINGGDGNDDLQGGAGADTYIFRVGDGTDIINEEEESVGTSIINLRFEGSQYVADDFLAGDDASFTKERVGDSLVIRLDKNLNDEITDQVTIEDAYNTGGNLQYTINVEYGVGGRFKVAAADAYWNSEGSETKPFLATEEANVFPGKAGADWVSYVDSLDAGVKVNLGASGDNIGWAEHDTLTNIQNIIGSPQGDTLVGNGESNSLRGGAGVDTLTGGAGIDFLYGGAGDDVINGGADDDTLHGGAGVDTLDGGAGADTLDGGADADTYIFRVGDGTDIITDALGGAMTLRFIGDYAVTDFAAGTNARFARDGVNLVITIDKDTADDITDQVTIEDAYNTGGNLRYTIKVEYGVEGSDSFTEITSADDYWSNLEAVTGEGTESNPFLATSGNNVITGEDGLDWVSYAGATPNGVLVNLVASGDNIGWAEHDTLTNIRNIIGSAQGDTLIGDGEANTLRGGASVDTLNGKAGVDTLEGGAGNDTLIGGLGGDTIDGGEGTDTASYSDAAEGVRVALSLTGTEAQQDFDGTNNFVANTNEAKGDILNGIEHIVGSAHADWLTGDEFANTLTGGAGNDRLEGGAGEDTIHGGEGADIISGGADDDTLNGDAGADTIMGGAGADTIIGGAGVDIISGGEGGDTLDGGAGDETIDGGAGEDTYIFRVDHGTDIITDVGGDTMTLRFEGSQYVDGDFLEGEDALFARDGDNLVITIDKEENGITDKVTINNAYGTDAFTINVEYGSEGNFNTVTADFWHGLTA